MFGLIKKIFVVLITSIVNASNHTLLNESEIYDSANSY